MTLISVSVLIFEKRYLRVDLELSINSNTSKTMNHLTKKTLWYFVIIPDIFETSQHREGILYV